MVALLIFIFISALVISGLLFFNKGEKAQEIKTILKEILKNLKELFSNLKSLFLILKDLIQSKLDNEPIRLSDESTSNDPSKSDSSNKPSSLPSAEIETSGEDLSNETTEKSGSEVIEAQGINSDIKVETQSEDSSPEATEESKPDVIDTQGINSDIKVETQSEDSSPEETEESKPDVTKEIAFSSESNSTSQDINPNLINSKPIKKSESDFISSEKDSPEEYPNDYEDLNKKNQ